MVGDVVRLPADANEAGVTAAAAGRWDVADAAARYRALGLDRFAELCDRLPG